MSDREAKHKTWLRGAGAAGQECDECNEELEPATHAVHEIRAQPAPGGVLAPSGPGQRSTPRARWTWTDVARSERAFSFEQASQVADALAEIEGMRVDLPAADQWEIAAPSWRPGVRPASRPWLYGVAQG
jgi:hypothetical protein